MDEEEELAAVKERLKEQFFDVSGVVGFGLGDGVVLVYLETVAAGESLPGEVDGIAIEKVITGEIVAADEE